MQLVTVYMTIRSRGKLIEVVIIPKLYYHCPILHYSRLQIMTHIPKVYTYILCTLDIIQYNSYCIVGTTKE